MLKKLTKSKNLITIVMAALIVVIGLFGASWQVGQAETVPTLPTIPTLPTLPTIPLVGEIDPSSVEVGSPETVFTLTGEGFIDEVYTLIRWIGPGESGNVTLDITPTMVTDGTELTFKVPAAYLDLVGTGYVWVINHWQNIGSWEISGPYTVDIVPVPSLYYIYLPLILK
jgi:hypothetical protein